MKKLFLLIALFFSFQSFAQTEWVKKYYNKGDTVKVGEAVYVANRSFNSASQPPNSYWTLISGQPTPQSPTGEVVKYSIDFAVNWKPITDSIRILFERLAILEATPTGNNYDIGNLEEDIILLKNIDADFVTQLSAVKRDIIALRSRIENIASPIDYTSAINTLDAKILNLEQRLNNLPDGGGGSAGTVSGVTYAAASLGFVAGTDITAQLNAKSTGKIILFDGGVYAISGDVNANGTVYEFKNGSRLTGTGTISNAVIDAGDYHIFDIGISLKNARSTGPYVWWTWYGATPNNPNDNDQERLQKGIDVSIANPTLPRTYKGGSGYYHLDGGLVVYKWENGDYRFCDITIEGESDSWKNSEEYGTWLWQRNGQSFGINFQRVRSSGVRNVNFRGQAMYENFYGSYDKLFASNFDTYTQDYNAAQGKNILDTRSAMHTAIMVDGFSNGPLHNGIWPGFESWNRGTQQTGGSSGVTISHAYLYGWVIGIALSPSGTTYNAEHIYNEKLFLRSLKVGVSIGQDQNKNIPIEGVEAYNVHTVFDGMTYGKGIGAHVFVKKGSMANCYRLVNMSSQRFSSTFEDIITEEFKTIGGMDHGAMPTYFNNCGFEIFDKGSATPAYVWTGNNTHFNGGYIRTPSAPTFTRLAFKGSNITFTHVTMELPPIMIGTIETANGNTNGHFEGCNMLAYESLIGSNSTNSQNFSLFRNYFLYGDYSISSPMMYPGGFLKMDYSSTKYDYSYRLGGGTVSNIVNSTADFKLQFGEDYYPVSGLAVNDYLITDIAGGAQPIGRITAINYATGVIKLANVPENIKPGEYTTWGNYLRRIQTPFIGDITKGSNVITNIQETPYGMPQAGDRIEIDVDFTTASKPCFIVSVTGNTATVSRPMYRTVTGQNFVMGDPVISITSLQPFTTDKPILKGTLLKTKY